MQYDGLLSTLSKDISGEILTDDVSRGIYATDASMYQVAPIAVALPRDLNDLRHVTDFASRHGLPLLPRAGGTSLAGQTVNEALVVDISKYLNRIVEFNAEERWVRVEPGVVLDELNAFLKPHGLQFAPDPATSSRCGIGGMIANNSSGTRSILYGKTIDHVLEVNMLLGDGTELQLKEHAPDAYDLIANGEGRASAIYRKFRELIFANAEEIRKRYPKTLRRVSGYPLDAFVDSETWNLAKLVCGSEGTLGFITEAKLNLVALPRAKAGMVIHFRSIEQALIAVEPLLAFEPAAVELLNADVLELSKRNSETRKAMTFLEGEPDAVLIVELYGDTKDTIREKGLLIREKLEAQGHGFAWPLFFEGPDYENIWSVRKKGLGIMMGTPESTKPLAFIEDAAVPVEFLPGYVSEMLAYCASMDVKLAAYAHASVGVIHLRPFLDLGNPDDISKIRKISETAFEKVKALGGSWSSEHGDGLSRGEFIRRFYGDSLYGVFREVKSLFDPQNLFNPNRIVDVPPMDTQLRSGRLDLPGDFQPRFQYRSQIDFSHAMLQCTGIGVCRKTTQGTMCPSYMATRDEEHSTRGRANALRTAIEGGIDLTDNTRLQEVFDLCLSCKACKSECPSNVDMARLKAELLGYRYTKRAPGFRERMIRDSVHMARRLSGGLARIVNPLQGSYFFKFLQEAMLGIDRRRTLPAYATRTFENWYHKQEFTNSDPQILLFADSYLNYYEPETGEAIVDVLKKFGMTPSLFSGGCCQRPRISNGFLDIAQQEGRKLLDKLIPQLEKGATLIVCEPSCHSALTDDLPDLVADDREAELLNRQVVSLEGFIAKRLEESGNPVLVPTTSRAIFHGHCHQKALQGTDAFHAICSHFEGLQMHEPDSGCCGMAGAFGYEKEHFSVSGKIGERVLFPEIRSNPESGVFASGFSCRHQIRDFTGRRAKHWIALFSDHA